MDDAAHAADQEHVPSQSKKPRKRLIMITGAVLVLVIIFAGGWTAAALFQSPAQRAAQAKAPPPGSITAEVTRGALEDVVHVKVDIARAQQQTVPLASNGSVSVVTKQVVASGAKVSPFAAVTEVNGRPVFAVPGRFPFYRNLSLGDVGPDVAQLQAGLEAAGYRLDADGRFGPATEKAMRAAYRTSGYALPTTAQTTLPSIDPDANTPTEVTTMQVPLTELAVFPALPATLLTAPPVGAALAAGSSITAEAGPVTASASVPDAVALRLRVGMNARLTGENVKAISLTIATITKASVASGESADKSAPDAAAASGSSLVIFVPASGATIPDSALRTEEAVAITVTVSAKDSLIVPTVAVVSGGPGHGWVLKRNRDGSFTKVPVIETGQLAGQSAITVVGDANLRVHDKVKVS